MSTAGSNNNRPLQRPFIEKRKIDDFAMLQSPRAHSPSTFQEKNADFPNDVDVELTPPSAHITLKRREFFFFVLFTGVFYGVFTAIFLIGIVLDHVYEEVGSSKKADALVEKYNTANSYITALLGVLMGVHMDKFTPVFQVSLHNFFWFLAKSERWCGGKRIHNAILFMFPIALTVMLENSMNSLQAAHSTVGFESIMLTEDLATNSNVSVTTSNATTNSTKTVVSSTILKNAIDQQTTPFAFDTQSPCVQGNDSVLGNGQRIVPLPVHELDLTSVVYGFVPREWNKEALMDELEPTYSYKLTYAGSFDSNLQEPTDFDMATAFTIFFHGKIMVEKALGDAKNQNYACSLSDGRYDLDVLSNTTTNDSASSSSGSTASEQRRILQSTSISGSESTSAETNGTATAQEADDSIGHWTIAPNGTRICQGAVTSIFDILAAQQEEMNIGILFDLITNGMNKSFPGLLDLDQTELILERYNITPQISVDTMRIDLVLDESVHYGLTPQDLPCFFNDTCEETFYNTSAYVFSNLANSFCGSKNCAFLDASNTFDLQKEIGLVPLLLQCDDIAYSGDYRGYYPINCIKQENAAILYGIGSYITGSEYGSIDETYGTDLPYILNPRRHVRLTFAQLTWHTENIPEAFDAHCAEYTDGTTAPCDGLWYHLQYSGRYVFAGTNALPTTAILNAELHAPVQLLQLNSPTLYVPQWPRNGKMVSLEWLDFKEFDKLSWDISLSSDACSVFIDSYLHQIETNNFYLDRPLQVMYTAAVYYLLQDGAVTEINTDNSSATTKLAAEAAKSDMLNKLKLQGDQQIREIRVSIPSTSFYTSFIGCILLLVLAALVLLFPTRRVAYFAENTSKAQEFIDMSKEEDYPRQVYRKQVIFPAENQQVSMDELHIEHMTLVATETHTEEPSTIQF